VIGLPESSPVLADSITKAGESAAGRVVVTGSHGGIYAAYLACKSKCRAVIFNDAGIGFDSAGIGGLAWLEPQGMAAAAIDTASAEIGNAAQMLARGRISSVNNNAQKLGLKQGMPCAQAAELLAVAPPPDDVCPVIREGREVLNLHGATRRLILVDSASLVISSDRDQVVVTGSHGALFGGNPANALKVDALLALFNDAGSKTGTTRLPALNERGVAAVTVAANSARIGDARSTWEDGIISALNTAAERLGAQIGTPARDFIHTVLTKPTPTGG